MFSHWNAKFATSDSARGSASMPLHLLREHLGVAQLAAARRARSSSSSGRLLHRKNDSRDASSRSLSAIRAPARDRRRRRLRAIEEVRAREDARQRAADAALEAAVAARPAA